MDLKISLKSQLYALRDLIITSIVYFMLIYFLYINTEFDLFKILFLSTFAYYLLLFLLPVTVLHINYLRNTSKDIRVEENKLTIKENIIYRSDIEKIRIYASSQHFSGNVGVTALPFNDYYFYLEIKLKNGEKINLSSLLDYKIDKIIKENFKNNSIVEQASPFLMLLIK